MEALFPKGNLDSWVFSIKTYLPKAVSVVTKTVDPVIRAALLALLGNSTEFTRDQGNCQFVYDDAGLPYLLKAILTYSVPAFKVDNVTEEAVARDKQFILAYLKQVSGFQLQSLDINTKEGSVVVSFTVKVGY